eukprot:scaffold8150_cov116-Isochrysis_galbana.AAC.5
MDEALSDGSSLGRVDECTIEPSRIWGWGGKWRVRGAGQRAQHAYCRGAGACGFGFGGSKLELQPPLQLPPSTGHVAHPISRRVGDGGQGTGWCVPVRRARA